MIEEIQTENSYLICGLDESQKGLVNQPDKPEIVVAAFSYNPEDGIPQKFRSKRDRNGALEWIASGGEYVFSLLKNEEYKHRGCNLYEQAPKLIQHFMDLKNLSKAHLGIHFDGLLDGNYEEELISFFSYIPRDMFEAKAYSKKPNDEILRTQPRIVRIADGVAYYLSHLSVEELTHHPNFAYACD